LAPKQREIKLSNKKQKKERYLQKVGKKSRGGSRRELKKRTSKRKKENDSVLQKTRKLKGRQAQKGEETVAKTLAKD